jgi:hypothetical protein
MMKECDHGNPNQEERALIPCFLLLYCPVPMYLRQEIASPKRECGLVLSVSVDSEADDEEGWMM